MQSYATPRQNHYASVTPIQRPLSSSETLRSNYYANIQAAGSYSGGQTMAPPAHLGPGNAMVSPPYGNTYAASVQLAMNTSFASTQMQTPPPTRGGSARKPQQPQQIAFGTPSTIASRRFMTPQQTVLPSNNAQPAPNMPVQYPQLHFSPDLYQFTNLGPASAPAVPHAKVLWASNSPVQPIPQATLDDPFVPATSSDLSWPVPEAQQNGVQAMSFDTPAMNSFPLQPPHPKSASAVPQSTSHLGSGHEGGSTGVDPSLLYSSPVRHVVRSSSRTKKPGPPTSTSETQTRHNSTMTHNRSDTVSTSDTVISHVTSSLQRSNTTGASRPKSAHISMPAIDSLSRSNSGNLIPRTDSPVKRFRRPPLGSISEGKPRQRTSVVLTVDENGRARTETRRLDASPERSIRERYPALFDSDSSDAESDSSEQTPSRPSSFIFDKRDERRTKAAKLDPPVENLEGLSIPRSGSSTSMRKGVPPSRAAVAAAAQLRRQSSLRRSTPSRNQNRKSLMANSTTSIDTCPMDVTTSQQQHTNGEIEQATFRAPHDEDNGMKWNVAGDTFRVPSFSAETALESTLEQHNRRWSMMSFEQQHHAQVISPPQQQQYQGSAYPDVSVHMQQHPRPPSRPLHIRCVCGVSNDNGQTLIQCQSCTQWLHAPCVVSHQHNIPQPFTCFLCTKPPPTTFRGKVGLAT